MGTIREPREGSPGRDSACEGLGRGYYSKTTCVPDHLPRPFYDPDEADSGTDWYRKSLERASKFPHFTAGETKAQDGEGLVQCRWQKWDLNLV